jgi:hypothetical protein
MADKSRETDSDAYIIDVASSISDEVLIEVVTEIKSMNRIKDVRHEGKRIWVEFLEFTGHPEKQGVLNEIYRYLRTVTARHQAVAVR